MRSCWGVSGAEEHFRVREMVRCFFSSTLYRIDDDDVNVRNL